MLTWIVIASGGALGCMVRHGVNRLVHQQWPMMRFPAATLIVNLIGCCVVGALAGLIASGQLPMRLQWREFVFVGLLGGFTSTDCEHFSMCRVQLKVGALPDRPTT